MNKICALLLSIVSIQGSFALPVSTDGNFSIMNTDKFKTGTHNVYGKHSTVITSKSVTVSMKSQAQIQCESKKSTIDTRGEWVVNGTERCYDEVKRRTDYYWDASGQICTSQTEVFDSKQYMCQPDPKATCEAKAPFQTQSTKEVSKPPQICQRTTTYNNTYSWNGSSCVVNSTAISTADSQCRNDLKSQCEAKASYETKGNWDTGRSGMHRCWFRHHYTNDYIWSNNTCKVNTTLRYTQKSGCHKVDGGGGGR